MTTSSPQNPQVTLTPQALTLHRVVVTEPDVLRAAHRRAQHADTDSDALARYATTALVVGVRALTVAESSLDLADLDRTLTGLGQQVQTSTDAALTRLTAAVEGATDPSQGAISRSLSAHLDQLTGQITALVAGKDAPVPAAVAASVRAVTDNTLGEVQRAVAAQADAVRRVLATDTPGSPLHDLKTGLVEGLNASHHRLAAQLADLRTAIEVDKANAAANAKAPQHGLDTETATLTVLEQLAHTAGDQLEHTGTTPGLIPRCLKGDGVITLTPPPGHTGPPMRVVVEVKDRERAQSLTAWKTLLAESAENRQAIAAVGIVKSPDQMPGQRRLHVLDPTTYLLAYDPASDDQDLLVAAYHLLRAHTWHKALTGQPSHGVDLPALRAAAGELGNALNTFDTLTRHHNAARRSIDQADQAAATLRTDLQGRIDATRQLLNGHPGTEAGNPAA